MPFCPKCSEEVAEGDKFCGACGVKLPTKTTPGTSQPESVYHLTEPRKAAMSEEPKEVVFYSDARGVRVTNTRLIIMRRRGSTTYSIVNITSVSEEKIGPNRSLGLVLAISGIMVLAGGYFLGSDIALICGAVLFGLGILLAAFVRPTYVLMIGSASGESVALRHKDRHYIHGIVTAMNEAIIKRGW